MIPLLIGLRSALIILCLSSVLSWGRVGLPKGRSEKLRVLSWIVTVLGTGAIWSPFSIASLTGHALEHPLDLYVRLAGVVAYIVGLLLGAASFTIRRGGTTARAWHVVGVYLLMTAAFVALAFLRAGRA